MNMYTVYQLTSTFWIKDTSIQTILLQPTNDYLNIPVFHMNILTLMCTVEIHHPSILYAEQHTKSIFLHSLSLILDNALCYCHKALVLQLLSLQQIPFSNFSDIYLKDF